MRYNHRIFLYIFSALLHQLYIFQILKHISLNRMLMSLEPENISFHNECNIPMFIEIHF